LRQPLKYLTFGRFESNKGETDLVSGALGLT
jgi:hypothetical protein